MIIQNVYNTMMLSLLGGSARQRWQHSPDVCQFQRVPAHCSYSSRVQGRHEDQKQTE